MDHTPDDTTGASVSGTPCPPHILRNLRDLQHDDGFRVEFLTLADVQHMEVVL